MFMWDLNRWHLWEEEEGRGGREGGREDERKEVTPLLTCDNLSFLSRSFLFFLEFIILTKTSSREKDFNNWNIKKEITMIR